MHRAPVPTVDERAPGVVRRRPVAVLVAVLALVVTACGTGGDDASRDTAGPTTSTTAPSTTTSERVTTSTASTTTTMAPPTTAPTTTAPTTTAPPTTTTTAPAPTVLSRGDRGPEVEALQARLVELRYWVGEVDGIYGNLTVQAVQAFQKVNGITVDGRAGPEVRAALAAPRPPAPQSTAGLVWEVDKATQVLLLVRDGAVEWIWHTSTGTEQPYTYQGRQLLADTPPGRFTIDWQVDGWRDGALGRLYRPKYFHPDGIAIHGYGSVPAVPASHGCVRVTFAAMDYIWANGLAPVGTSVWVYGQAPTVAG